MTPPNPPNPRMHVVNPGEEKKKSQRWETIQTVAITTLVGLAVGGIGIASWRLATRRVTRLLRRQSAAEQEAVAAAPLYPQAPGYPVYAQYPGQPPQQYAYPPPPMWASPAVREQMPDALRDVPTFAAAAAAVPTVVAAPPPVQPIIHAPPIGADPTFRKFMQNLEGRFSSIDQRLSQINEQLGDYGEGGDDDEDEGN